MAAKRNIPYSTYITSDQLMALQLLAKVRGTKETVIIRAALDAYIQQCAGELKAILAVRQKALDADDRAKAS